LTLSRLAEHGVKETILAVNFMADTLEQTFGSSRFGMKIHYSKDIIPNSQTQTKACSPKSLGTGGAIKQAENLLDDKEPFLALNGDILTNANYSDILETHRKLESLATIALRRVKNPSRYGVVRLSDGNHISEFVEKPSSRAPSNLANAGIYVFEPQILELIPKSQSCSIEREIFPKLTRKKGLVGHEIRGLWVDVGKPSDYIKANKLWLNMQSRTHQEPMKTGIEGSTKIKKAVAIGEDVRIKEGAIIGPNVSLGKKVYVGLGAQIRDSIIFPRTIISDYAIIEGTVIGEAAVIGKKVRTRQGCLIGDNTIIHDNITLAKDVKICPSKEIFSNIVDSGCVI
jgi:NDP-sugar pyrophosphorylase family protein